MKKASLKTSATMTTARYYKDTLKGCRVIEAVWCPDEPDCSWAYKTDIPHVTFDVVEDGELYCRGIVFRLADAKAESK